jgi:hypothetical protein
VYASVTRAHHQFRTIQNDHVDARVVAPYCAFGAAAPLRRRRARFAAREDRLTGT